MPAKKVKISTLKVIHCGDIPYWERNRGFDDVSWGDASYTLVRAKDLLDDRLMRLLDSPGPPTQAELDDPENIQPLAWELHKIAKKYKNVYIALNG